MSQDGLFGFSKPGQGHGVQENRHGGGFSARLGIRRSVLSRVMHGTGDVFLHAGEHASAEPWFLESIRIAREINEKWAIFDALFHLVTVYVALGQLARAKAACFEGLRLAAEFGLSTYIARLFNEAAEIAKEEGRPGRAARLSDAGCDLSVANDSLRDEDAALGGIVTAHSSNLDHVLEYALSDED